MTLKELEPGGTGTIISVGGDGALRQHFLDMGVIPGADVTVVKYAPMGDPVELLIHGYELTLRLDDAAKIEITSAEAKQSAAEQKQHRKKNEHPGLPRRVRKRCRTRYAV